MFARAFASAREFLTRSYSSPGPLHTSTVRSAEGINLIEDPSVATMVTTRGGHDTHSPAVEPSDGKTARKRAAGQRDSPVPAKRRRAISEEAAMDTRREESLPEREVNGKIKPGEVVDTHAPQSSTGRLRSIRRSPEVIIEVPSQRQKPRNDLSAENAQRQDSPSSGPESVYATPATQGTVSLYATPATHMKRTAQASAKRSPASHIPPTRLAPVDEGSRWDAEGSDFAPTSQESKAEDSPQLRRAKRRRNSGADLTASKKHADLQTSAKANGTSGPPISQRRHIRFDENGDAPPGEQSSSAAVNLSEIPSLSYASEAKELQTDDGSEDEAPETITKTSAVEAARAADAEATRAIEQQEAVVRKKRQERDARLKEQAEGSKRNRKRSRLKKIEQPDEPLAATTKDLATPVDAEDDAASAPPPKYDIRNLPALLPSELLATASVPRPPTPPPVTTAPPAQSRAMQQKQRLKFLDAATKTPKDVKRGPVNVRVLTEMNKLLAPKVDVNGRNMRETWLAGRRGRGGSGGTASFEKMERRAIKGGFLRK